jgi:rhamnogalacturonyl hydrolase YesR
VRTLSILRRNFRKLVVKLAGMFWPPNFLVVIRNFADILRHEPWMRVDDSSPSRDARLRESADQALAWISWSQDKEGTGGVGSYDFSGWSRGYPEVTGYIIPTIWDYARHTQRQDLRDRAIRMADWLLRMERNGEWEGGVEGDGIPALVFNTGQVVRGLLRTYQETADRRYLDAARRGSDWIVGVQDDDGSWTRSNHLGLKRVYDTYVAAPLSQLSLIDGDDRYAEAARRNCEFVLTQQRNNGWFDLCDNTPDFVEAPITHAICYTADGLIETGQLLDEESYVAAGSRAADAMAAHAEPTGYLPGRFDEDWQPRVRWVCLTGSAQLGNILMRRYASVGDTRYLTIAERLAGFLHHVQRLNSVGRNRRGAIAGSYPIWGPYAPLRFPCWATKYYLDLLLMVSMARKGRAVSLAPA